MERDPAECGVQQHPIWVMSVGGQGPFQVVLGKQGPSSRTQQHPIWVRVQARAVL